jgi:3-hydroxyacyl-[acyl-carrier-protein] dehydratase
MAPQLLFDISGIDLSKTVRGVEEIERVNPHRGAMRMLDGICHVADDLSQTLAYKDVRDDEFWVPGHIPGRPLFPGVMMIEAAAQLASYITLLKQGGVRFMGFAGVDQVKFRGMVVPGDRFFVLAKLLDYRPRRSICAAQGLVNGNLVFEATITGMPM